MTKVLGILLAVVVIVGGGGYLLATRADAATPSDPLFKLDLFFEDVQRIVTLDDVEKTELEQEILEERSSEVEEVLALEDVSEEAVGDAMEYMNQQRVRTYERLGEVQLKLEEKGNDQAAESLQKVQEKFAEHLEEQLKTTEKVQEKFEDVGKEIKEDIQENIEQEENSLNNEGEDTENQQQNQEQNENSSSTPKGKN
ncbi:MAG: DUF5667 domain-containing protein [Candidatus Dojkabacteria bacterium]